MNFTIVVRGQRDLLYRKFNHAMADFNMWAASTTNPVSIYHNHKPFFATYLGPMDTLSTVNWVNFHKNLICRKDVYQEEIFVW